ncbi:MAG TPA: type II toxin-antitoxin system HicA family toxin [Thermomicrobiales bacterium]|nr:type II toxin-antitoxin system HicA family toxin [Thermomicrobiales bacterium]
MPRKIRQLKADLRRAGFMWRPGKGSHTVWGHELIPDQVTLSGKDGDDARDYQERTVQALLAKVREAQRRQE